MWENLGSIPAFRRLAIYAQHRPTSTIPVIPAKTTVFAGVAAKEIGPAGVISYYICMLCPSSLFN
jgi:hypothetical protein